MSMKITSSQYKKLAIRCHKYNAKQTIIDGIKFPSKKEANFYQTLKIRKANKEISGFHRQVIFDLPGGIKYLCDFMIIYYQSMTKDSCIEYIDVKGRDTPISKLKRKQVLDLYGVKITIV